MANERRLLNKQAILNIITKYGLVTTNLVGETMRHTIERVGGAFDVKKKTTDTITGEVIESTVPEFGKANSRLQKKIITFKAISELGHKFHKTDKKEAWVLEQAGDLEAADALYQKYLDGARFTCSILSSDKSNWNADIQRGDKVKVDVVDFDGKILRGENPRIIAAIDAAPLSAKFITSMFDEDIDDDTTSAVETNTSLAIEAEM